MYDQGFAIGNGLTDPIIQYPAYPDFALDMNLIQQSDYDNIESELVPPCTQAASLCGRSNFLYFSLHFVCNTHRSPVCIYITS